MANAKRDGNRTTTITGVLNSNGTTVANVCVNASNHALCAEDDTTGSDNGPSNRALHDENHVATYIAASSDGDGALVALYVNGDGELLIQST